MIKAESESPNQSARAIFFATCSGGVTLDLDEAGGNPFTSALIELAGEPKFRLPEMPTRLRDLTALKSEGRQVPDFSVSDLPDWSFHKRLMSPAETRDALILVVSNYSASDIGSSLRGAAWDELRISAMLAQNGFSVTQGIAPRRDALVRALGSFRRRSAKSDVAIIYSTGHGLELDGEVYLIPGDYLVDFGYGVAQLRRFAVGVSRIAESAAAKRLNLVFFAGCRHKPRRKPTQFSEMQPPNSA